LEGLIHFGKCLYILWSFGIFYRHLGYFMTIWYILCSFGTFFPVLVSYIKKNLATLVERAPPSFVISGLSSRPRPRPRPTLWHDRRRFH
jgi:hypothetical protein